MKTFCVLAVALLATVCSAIDISLRDQTCIDIDKVKELATGGPADKNCADIANIDASPPGTVVDVPEKGKESKTKDIFEVVKMVYDCFVESQGIRDDQGNSDIGKVKEAIKLVAKDGKAEVINAAIDKCANGATTVSKEQRSEGIMCVIAGLMTGGQCHANE